MELSFREETLRYLSEKICDNLYQEQTAEMTIPEDMPAICRIVDCFGTVLVQSRTVSDGSVSVTGGIQAGVLYTPEGEEGLERVDVYLPFTVSKKLPTEESATLFYWGWLKSIDARFINNRKLLVRANLGSELTLLSPAQLQLKQVESCPAGLQCKNETFPMRLPLYAAEKEIQIADEVMMPEQEIGADRLLKWSCSAEVEESRVVGDKAVFKGNIRVKVLYRSEDGRLSVWDGAVPYSQYAELGGEAEDGIVSVQPIFRHVEIDTDGQIDSRRLLLNLSLTAQVLVRGEISVSLTQDAYYLGGEFTPQWQNLELTPCLDHVIRETEVLMDLPAEAGDILDWTLFSDQQAQSSGQPRPSRCNITGNVMFYDESKAVQAKTISQEADLSLEGEENCDRFSVWRQMGQAQRNGKQLRVPVRTELIYFQKPGLRTLAGGTFTDSPVTEGPSLIVKKAQGSLWDLAKENGSTVEALQQANGLEEDYLPDQRLLLIPTRRSVYAPEEEAE